MKLRINPFLLLRRSPSMHLYNLWRGNVLVVILTRVERYSLSLILSIPLYHSLSISLSPSPPPSHSHSISLPHFLPFSPSIFLTLFLTHSRSLSLIFCLPISLSYSLSLTLYLSASFSHYFCFSLHHPLYITHTHTLFPSKILFIYIENYL